MRCGREGAVGDWIVGGPVSWTTVPVVINSRRANAGTRKTPPRGSTGRRVAKDHFLALVISIVVPLADHFLDGGLGISETLRPLARVRGGFACVAASAVEIRWIVDHRASSRPFSMREMSACGMPLRLASSACVQPSSIRRSRIESPGWESSASADQVRMRTIVCGLTHIRNMPSRLRSSRIGVHVLLGSRICEMARIDAPMFVKGVCCRCFGQTSDGPLW